MYFLKILGEKAKKVIDFIGKMCEKTHLDGGWFSYKLPKKSNFSSKCDYNAGHFFDSFPIIFVTLRKRSIIGEIWSTKYPKTSIFPKIANVKTLHFVTFFWFFLPCNQVYFLKNLRKKVKKVIDFMGAMLDKTHLGGPIFICT